MPDSVRRSYHTAELVFLVAGGLLFLPGCEQPLPQITSNEVTITAENFDAEVLQSDVPVLIDFGAVW